MPDSAERSTKPQKSQDRSRPPLRARTGGVEVRSAPATQPGFVRYETYYREELIHFTELRADRDAPDLPKWLLAYFRLHRGIPDLRLED